MSIERISQSRLKEIFSYDAENGLFTRVVTRSGRALSGSIVGNKLQKGYLGVKIDGSHYKLHRLAWLYVYGEFPTDQIDHINGIKDDNRIENLRAVNNSENQRNKRIQKNNNTGTHGVSWCSHRNKWRARVNKPDGTRVCLGRFSDIEKAIRARKAAEIKYGYHPNHG